jgi:hypothetical protein
MWMKKWGAKVDGELADSHAYIQALEKKLGKRFAWYERDTEVSGSRPVSIGQSQRADASERGYVQFHSNPN